MKEGSLHSFDVEQTRLIGETALRHALQSFVFCYPETTDLTRKKLLLQVEGGALFLEGMQVSDAPSVKILVNAEEIGVFRALFFEEKLEVGNQIVTIEIEWAAAKGFRLELKTRGKLLSA